MIQLDLRLTLPSPPFHTLAPTFYPPLILIIFDLDASDTGDLSLFVTMDGVEKSVTKTNFMVTINYSQNTKFLLTLTITNQESVRNGLAYACRLRKFTKK